MVSTRQHPSDFAPSPSKPLSARSTASPSPPSKRSLPPPNPLAPTSPTPTPTPTHWTHTPSHLTLTWLALSLPLVLWDTGYVLLRPHSMPGGRLHWPLWSPYKLYGEVDYIYGSRAWEGRNGFTAAQGVLNLLETGLYGWYGWVVWRQGQPRGGNGQGRQGQGQGQGRQVEGRGAPETGRVGWWGEARVVSGRGVAVAVVVAFAASVMTVSKTVLYWLNEYFSGFDNIGHNSPLALIFLWILPNGAWLVFPSYMIYVFGQEILQGLEVGGGDLKAAKDR